MSARFQPASRPTHPWCPQQWLYRLPNGWGVSVVRNPRSHAWETALLNREGDLPEQPLLVDGTRLTWPQVEAYLVTAAGLRRCRKGHSPCTPS